jgi:N-acetylglucosamine-6-phosphate deacetylase
VVDGRIDAVGSGHRSTGGGPAADRPHEGPGAAAPRVIDLGGMILAPGFIDLHVHGGGGAQFMGGDPAACRRAARFHAARGSTGLLATTVSAPREALAAAVHGIAEAMADEPVILGCHLEGPWLNPLRRGAHAEACLRAPDPAELHALTAPGVVRLISLAPELPGGLELVAAVVEAGAVAALAHTDATHAEAVAAIAAGARHATHLFNGMRPFHHRDPGVVGAVLDDDRVTCELIADGHHVHAAAMRLALRAKRTDRAALVTDATEAAGLPDGVFRLGGGTLRVVDGRAVTEDGRLAGTTLTMDAAVRHVHRSLGVPLGDAVALATTTPARVLGLDERKGRIAPGYDADLVVLDAELRPRATLLGGEWVGESP